VVYVRTVRTSSGAVAVQVVWKSRRGSREIEHLGSAHTAAEVEVLKAVAAQRIAAGQDELPLEVAATQEPMPLEITSSRMGRLVDVIAAVYRQLGFDQTCGKDAVFEQLVTAPIIEPTSKQDAARVLAEAGMGALSYRIVKRRLPGYAKPEWRNRLSGRARPPPRSALWVLYDVTTLWFDTDTGDGFREPGFSKERRLDPPKHWPPSTNVRTSLAQVGSYRGWCDYRSAPRADRVKPSRTGSILTGSQRSLSSRPVGKIRPCWSYS
jgi:hypothetical protein